MTFARPDICPAFSERNIPVVLSTDEKYLPYVKAVVNSAITCTTGGNLDFLILHMGIPDGAIQSAVGGYAGHANVSVRFIDVGDALGASKLADFKQVDRLPLSTCYRLMAPDMLVAYGKVLYLDVDIAVRRDLGALYETDVEGFYFAAARDVVHSTKREYVEWGASHGFSGWDRYVNAGVLVMNLEMFRRDALFERLVPIALEAAKWTCDQDALNVVCDGRIKALDPRWNVQLGDYCLMKQRAITGNEAWIAHFTGGQKPWQFPVRPFAIDWWMNLDEKDADALWKRACGNLALPPRDGPVKVSVVIPVFNAARYLNEAIASALLPKGALQIEVICVDDGSTDGSGRILKFWEARDSRLKVLSQANQGPGVARNAALKVARGEYVFFLDADDRLVSLEAIAHAYGIAKERSLDILLATYDLMDEYGTVVRRTQVNRDRIPLGDVFSPDDAGIGLYMLAIMGPGGKLFRRAFLEKERIEFPPLRRSEDFPMVQLAMSLASRIGILDGSLHERRTGLSTSLESTKDETPLIFCDGERVFRESLKARGLCGIFADAARVASVCRIAYNLSAVRRYASFMSVVRYAEEHCFGKEGWDDGPPFKRFENAKTLLRKVAASRDGSDDLLRLFVELREHGAREEESFSCAAGMAAFKRENALKVAVLERSIEKWKRNVEESRARIEELLGQRKNRDERIAALERRVEAWKRNADESGARVEELLGQRKNRDERIAALEGRVMAWKRNVEEGARRIDELLAQRKSRDERLSELERRATGLRSELKRKSDVLNAIAEVVGD